MDAVCVQDQEGSSVYGLKDAMFLAILQSYGTDCAPRLCDGMPLGEHRHCDPGLLKDGKSDPCDIHLHVLPCFSLLTLQRMALDDSLDWQKSSHKRHYGDGHGIPHILCILFDRGYRGYDGICKCYACPYIHHFRCCQFVVFNAPNQDSKTVLDRSGWRYAIGFPEVCLTEASNAKAAGVCHYILFHPKVLHIFLWGNEILQRI